MPLWKIRGRECFQGRSPNNPAMQERKKVLRHGHLASDRRGPLQTAQENRKKRKEKRKSKKRDTKRSGGAFKTLLKRGETDCSKDRGDKEKKKNFANRKVKDLGDVG